jgi:mono/diheme cytochrome c family protein
MKVVFCVAGLIIVLMLVMFTSSPSTAAPSSAASVARGKYLVEQVALCGDCHTPRNDKGEPIAGKLLKGAPVGFKPIVPMLVWADKAPNIAGLPGWEKDAAVKFFMTGIAYNDLPARLPMPQYRFTQQDAEAVVAYLRSLAPER